MRAEGLTERFGDGWSYPSMKNIRQFYLIYSKRLDTVYPIDTPKAKHCLANSEPRFTLSWSSYLVLMRIDNPDERSFYEIDNQGDRTLIHAKELYQLTCPS